MVKLIVMSGIPGSGKSTYAHKLARKEHAQVISSDAIRKELFGDESRNDDPKKVFGTMFYRIGRALKYKRSVIIDCVNATPSARKKFLRMYAGRFDRSICVFMSTPTEECMVRNSKRERVVPEEAIEKYAKRLEMPTREEGFDEIKIVT